MCVPEGLLPPLWVGGVGVLVVCCLRNGPLWFGVLVMWCVGVNACVFLMGRCPLWFGGLGVVV